MTLEVTNAVLVSCNISIWEANKRDSKISKEVVEQHGIKDKSMGRFWKSLLPRDPVLIAVWSAVRAAREFHYANTLPWMQEGARLLPTENYGPYVDKMRELRRQFEAAVEALLLAYPDLKAKAKELLNGLYREEDYPPSACVRSKFSFEIRVLPVPVGTAFVANIRDTDEVERIRNDIEQQVQESFRAANRYLWNQLYSAVREIKDRLADPKRRVEDATLANLRTLLDVMKRLNVSNDDGLEQMRQRAESDLGRLAGAMLKKHQPGREVALQKAQELTAAMGAFMGVAGG